MTSRRSARVLMSVFALAAAAHAGSIFDDDYVPPSAHKPASTTTLSAPTTKASTRAADSTASTPIPATGSLLAVPTAAEQAKSRKLFKEAYGDDLKDRAAPARRTLAAKLLAGADNVADDPADRFTLLLGACDAAAEGGDVPMAFRVVDALATLFDVDALRLKAETARRASFKGEAPARTAENVQAGLGLIDDLIAADDFADASRLLGALQSPAAGDATTATALKARAKRLADTQAAHDRYIAATDRLKRTPNDPAASVVAGQYLCFVSNRFDLGLPLLAHAADPALRAAAAAEQNATRDLAGNITAADAWWDLAEKGGPELYVAAMRRRAAREYEQALAGGKLTGLSRTRVEKRVATMRESTPAVESPPAPAKSSRNVVLFGGKDHDYQLLTDVLGDIKVISKDETADALASPNPFAGAQVICWGTNRWRELAKKLVTKPVGLALKRYVSDGGDLIFFEQYDGENMDIFQDLFGIQVHGTQQQGLQLMSPGIRLKAAALQPDITEEKLIDVTAWNTYDLLPAKSVTLARTLKDHGAAMIIAPVGRGRLILIGTNGDGPNTPFISAALHLVYDR